jgi:Cu(I)/Ag(I) efflux system membrane fusion protein
MNVSFQGNWWSRIYGKHAGKLWIGQAAVLLIIGFSIAWSMKNSSSTVNSAKSGGPHTEHKNVSQIWTCSMHPQIRRDGPGKCPICGMELVPVTTSAGGIRTIKISPTARKLMRIETTPVERRYVTAEIRMVGKVEYDETKLSYITAWVSGRLDRLYVDFTGIEVKKGDHLVYIYSEELYAAQEELIQALKYKRDRTSSSTKLVQPIDLVASAREKLRLLGLSAQQIKDIEQRGAPTDHITIYSPIGGVVIEKLRQEGDRVRTGDRIYTVADLNQVWVKLDAYESDLVWLHYGQKVEFTTEAYPGETFTGRIAFIDPVLNKDTRTVKVRVNVPNKDGKLKPEMFVRAVVRSQLASGGRVLDNDLAGKWISPMHPEIVKDKPGNCDICGMPLVRAETLGDVMANPENKPKPLVIPVSAALLTGTRAIVYVEIPTAKEPTFEGREIVLGPRAGGYYLVRSGLKEGDLVVTNGNFKLDSALQISAKPSMMTPEGGGGGGHDHGGAKSEKKTQQGETAGQQMTLPSQFRSQLDAVLNAFNSVTTAVEEADLAKIRAAFNQLGVVLSQVNKKQLTGHVEMLWLEFSMLLSNDVVEGRDVASLQDSDRIYLQLKRHIQRVREQFGMTHSNHQQAIIKIDVPIEFQNQLLPLLDVYLVLENSLASDNENRALATGPKLRQVLGTIQTSHLKEKALAVWKKEFGNLSKIADQLIGAKDIKTMRKAFALLSEEVLVVVKTFGVGNKRPLYELHCPMAFKGRGAIWLQNNDQVRNPYFGATMLKCADRVNLIPIDKEKQGSHADHQGHGHKQP